MRSAFSYEIVDLNCTFGPSPPPPPTFLHKHTPSMVPVRRFTNRRNDGKSPYCFLSADAIRLGVACEFVSVIGSHTKPGQQSQLTPSPRGLTFTWRGCCDFCLWQKPTVLAHSFLFCSCVCFCLDGRFNCISFHKFSRQLSAFSLCSSGLISALMVLSSIYLFMKVSFSPDIIPSG